MDDVTNRRAHAINVLLSQVSNEWFDGVFGADVRESGLLAVGGLYHASMAMLLAVRHAEGTLAPGAMEQLREKLLPIIFGEP